MKTFDEAVTAELSRVSHVEYDSHEICKHFAGKLRERLAPAIDSHYELLEALEHFAAFPLEDFGWEDKKPDHPITGFNSWKLTVGHILAIRAAIAKARGE